MIGHVLGTKGDSSWQVKEGSVLFGNYQVEIINLGSPIRTEIAKWLELHSKQNPPQSSN
jgi:hypothetical protein